MSKTTFEAGQIFLVLITAIGTLLAQAGLEFIKNYLQARDRRQESSDAVVIKQIEIDDHVRQDLHEWWQEQYKEARANFERAVKAEAERDALRKQVEELHEENRRLNHASRNLEQKLALFEYVKSKQEEESS